MGIGQIIFPVLRHVTANSLWSRFVIGDRHSQFFWLFGRYDESVGPVDRRLACRAEP